MKLFKRFALTFALALCFFFAAPKPAAAQAAESIVCAMTTPGDFSCGYSGPITLCYVMMFPCTTLPDSVQGPDDAWMWIYTYMGFLYNFFWIM